MIRLSVLSWLVSASAYADDVVVTHQGRLLDALGHPVDGPVTLTATVYDAATSGTDLWSKAYSVDAAQGYYSIELTGLDDSSTPRSLNDAVSASPRYLGVRVGSAAELLPRSRLGSAVTGGGAGVGAGSAAPGQSCATAGSLVWDAADGVLYACDGTAWFSVAATPNGAAHRYWRLLEAADDPTDHDYLGGFTLFTEQNGGGTNLGEAAGVFAYSVFGPNGAGGSHWDPTITLDFTRLTGATDNSDGRARCLNHASSGNCWVRIDLGTPQRVRSWGVMSRPNGPNGHWQELRLQYSDNGTTWTTVDERLGLAFGQAQVALFNL
jgi:hypothetical protein